MLMTRLILTAVLSLAVLGTPAIAQTPAAATSAGFKLAFINLQRLANESAEGKIATAKVQALNQQKVNELNDKNKQLQADQQKLAQGGTVLNDAARALIQKDIDKLTVDIERFQQDASAEVTEFQAQLQNEFQLKLQPIVEAMVKEMGLSILFSIADAGVVYVEPELDITVQVMKRFDAAMATAPSSATAPAAKPAAPSTPPAQPAPKPPQN